MAITTWEETLAKLEALQALSRQYRLRDRTARIHMDDDLDKIMADIRETISVDKATRPAAMAGAK